MKKSSRGEGEREREREHGAREEEWKIAEAA
jgi:hypothetical protein